MRDVTWERICTSGVPSRAVIGLGHYKMRCTIEEDRADKCAIIGRGCGSGAGRRGPNLRPYRPALPPSSSNNVLLVTSSSRPDHWIVPGGGVEPEEEPSMTAIREVVEEAGVLGKLGRRLGVFEVHQYEVPEPGGRHVTQNTHHNNLINPDYGWITETSESITPLLPRQIFHC
ncbi:unnamed protein product [Nezara viridula]|uniref:Nudix hydrolase domain-containing protein n=1 Tax=Nezara viridula TaxID=85310 RepID=A0A9P0MNI0_NEZVI|nr:unnamed protein product [Nezara viridula]